MPPQGTEDTAAAVNKYEYIIVGAGPAGVQMAYFMENAKRAYVVLEAGDGPCTFFKEYPRHRTLISINKRFNGFPEDEFNLRHDWNSLLSDNTDLRFPKYSDELFPPADTLVKYTEDYVNHFKLNVVTKTNVKKVSKITRDGTTAYRLETEGGVTYQGKVVIMACGAMKEKLPDIPGIDLASSYVRHSLKQEDWENKKICIVGAGNSGFEVANHLAGHAAVIHVYSHSPVKMAWDSHFPGHLRAINNTVIDMFHLKSLHAIREAEITKLEKVKGADGEDKLMMHFTMELPHWSPPGKGHFKGVYDDIIFCTGWYYVQEDMFEDNCRPVVTADGKMAVLSSNWQSSVEDLYYMGTCMQQRDKRAASSFIHGFRYAVRSLFHYLEYSRHSVDFPHELFNPIDFQALADYMIKRFSTTSGLYQMNYGVLCDLLVFEPVGEDRSNSQTMAGKATYYRELPGEWAEKNMLTKADDVWLIIFKDHKQSFPDSYRAESGFSVPPDLHVTNQHCSAFIQPIIKRYHKGELQEEFSLGGNLIVRVDIHQLHGDNNPVRFNNKLKNLLCRQFGKESIHDVSLFNPEVAKSSFTPWTQGEIDLYKSKQKEKNTDSPCRFAV